MSKIQKIQIQNFKAIDLFTADFKGMTAIVTAGNNKGKTSLLRGIVDRIRFIRPDVKVKHGEKSGKGELSLDDGTRFVWDFDDDKKDTLVFYDKDGSKKNVTKEFGKTFFPPTFDIDLFLNKTPKEQAKDLMKISGLDFEDVETRYAAAYQERTGLNEKAEKFHTKLSVMLKVERVEPVDLTLLQTQKQAIKDELNKLYISNRDSNNASKESWEQAKRDIDVEVSKFNNDQTEKRVAYNDCANALAVLNRNSYKGGEVIDFIEQLRNGIKTDKVASDLYPKEPTYITPEFPDDAEIVAIDAKIFTASETNVKAQAYKDYIAYKEQTEDANILADNADVKVKGIEAERKAMFAQIKFPSGIEIDATTLDLTYNKLPLNSNQVSLSTKYIAGLKIGAMNLGSVETLYFDASPLDKNSLSEIMAWANENGYQLLIEKPDFDGGEIEYRLIEN